MMISVDERRIGNVTTDGCANPLCIQARHQGRPFHAIPAGFAVTLIDYHFPTLAAAIAALIQADEKDQRIPRSMELAIR